MPTMLPATPKTFGDVRHVFSSCLSAIRGEGNPLGFPAANQVVAILVDGLGVHNIRERAGHAPFIAGQLGNHRFISAGFPTTTATSITSFATGEMAGIHGIVGYRIQDPTSKAPLNLLTGWNSDFRAENYQTTPTISQIAKSSGSKVYFVGAPEYEHSGFTSITMPGASFIGAKNIAQAFEASKEILAKKESSLTYLYIPYLDQTAHSRGWKSDRWAQLLEELDSEVRKLNASLRKGQAICLTADHGVVDVPTSGHIYLDELEQPKSGISLVGGDTRDAMLYLNESAETESYALTLTDRLSNRAIVLTKKQVIELDWYGTLADGISERLADVFILAKGSTVFYHRKFASTNSLKMIGHHGSLSPEELQIPLIRLGQFA